MSQVLIDNAAETAFLLRGSASDLWIDRMFSMEFLDDQLLGPTGVFSDEFYKSAMRDLNRYGFLGYII